MASIIINAFIVVFGGYPWHSNVCDGVSGLFIDLDNNKNTCLQQEVIRGYKPSGDLVYRNLLGNCPTTDNICDNNKPNEFVEAWQLQDIENDRDTDPQKGVYEALAGTQIVYGSSQNKDNTVITTNIKGVKISLCGWDSQEGWCREVDSCREPDSTRLEHDYADGRHGEGEECKFHKIPEICQQTGFRYENLDDLVDAQFYALWSFIAASTAALISCISCCTISECCSLCGCSTGYCNCCGQQEQNNWGSTEKNEEGEYINQCAGFPCCLAVRCADDHESCPYCFKRSSGVDEKGIPRYFDACAIVSVVVFVNLWTLGTFYIFTEYPNKIVNKYCYNVTSPEIYGTKTPTAREYLSLNENSDAYNRMITGDTVYDIAWYGTITNSLVIFLLCLFFWLCGIKSNTDEPEIVKGVDIPFLNACKGINKELSKVENSGVKYKSLPKNLELDWGAGYNKYIIK